ncbi:hypothetical protein AB0D04_40205 [Streptomyces sp. NPDC048483]|uniref:hypothetical protein n=1 Tax=Streptomyces sp. NPDC048483 TaxID=3154927 RepID=UPI003415952E
MRHMLSADRQADWRALGELWQRHVSPLAGGLWLRALGLIHLGEVEYQQQLRRCLNDEALQRELRIAGALICLYALPVSRIAELTTNRFHRDGQGLAYLTFERHPVLLPPKLARLIEDQITHRSTTNSLNRELCASDRYLLPGTVPGSPCDGDTLTKQLREKGLPVRAARNTAMIEAVTSLPPIVVADLLGLHPATVDRWANHANDSWASYLAARQNAGSGPVLV